MEKSLNKTYVTRVIKENEDTVVLFPDELLNELSLQDDDFLTWEVDQENNQIIVRKVKFVQS